jgi:hypothetical protein
VNRLRVGVVISSRLARLVRQIMNEV